MTGRIDLYKPSGMSSHSAVSRVRKLLGAKRAGHSGTLDPMATGVLNIYLDGATKFIDLLKGDEKIYEASMRFGLRSDTLDIWGSVEEVPGPVIQREQLEEALSNFIGSIRQCPPMVSAIKQQGVPLYRLARQGITVERKKRDITIHSLELLDFEYPEASFRVHCSKGTYIRTLIDDLGRALGSSALMSGLLRRENDGVSLWQCVSLEDVGAEDVKDLSSGSAWPIFEIDSNLLERLRRGEPNLTFSCGEKSERLLLHYEGRFVGTARWEEGSYRREKMVFE